MTAGFVAAILGGFEGTLDAVVERLAEGDLRREIEELQQQIAEKREELERQDARERLATTSRRDGSLPSKGVCRTTNTKIRRALSIR
jgi:hypothetical protein